MHERIKASGCGTNKTPVFSIVFFFFSLLLKGPVDKRGPYIFYIPTLIWGTCIHFNNTPVNLM